MSSQLSAQWNSIFLSTTYFTNQVLKSPVEEVYRLWWYAQTCGEEGGFLWFADSTRLTDPLETAMATHSSTLAWKIPWVEEPGRLQSMGSQRVRQDWATSLSLFTRLTGRIVYLLEGLFPKGCKRAAQSNKCPQLPSIHHSFRSV